MEITKKVVIGVALGFLLGFGSAWIYLDKSTDKIAGDSINQEETETSKEGGEINSTEQNIPARLVISEQPAGDRVLIDRATLEEQAWVVIYEDNDGELGRILGARLFPKGTTEDREVLLLRSTISTRRYYALVHTESGDGDFDYKDDIALTDADGERLVITSFSIK